MNDLTLIREKVASLHVLIVDDEDDLRDSIIKFMKKIFTHVDGAQNGAIALAMVKEDSSYDIVFTDNHMPKMRGTELVAELRKIYPKIFIALMTGLPDEDSKYADLCDMFIAKPIDINNIKIMLELIIEKKGL